MKLVKENIEFKRGQDIHKGLGVGKYAIIKNPSVEYMFDLPYGYYMFQIERNGYLYNVGRKEYAGHFSMPSGWKITPENAMNMGWYGETNFYDYNLGDLGVLSIQRIKKYDDQEKAEIERLGESIEFKRGKNVADALNVGPYAEVENPSHEYLDNLDDGLYIVSSDLGKNKIHYIIVKIDHNREPSEDGRIDVVEGGNAWENTKIMAGMEWKLGEHSNMPSMKHLYVIWPINSIQRLKKI